MTGAMTGAMTGSTLRRTLIHADIIHADIIHADIIHADIYESFELSDDPDNLSDTTASRLILFFSTNRAISVCIAPCSADRARTRRSLISVASFHPSGKFLPTLGLVFSTWLLLRSIVHRVSLWATLRHSPSSATYRNALRRWMSMARSVNRFIAMRSGAMLLLAPDERC
jgi:hypothetical protein